MQCTLHARTAIHYRRFRCPTNIPVITDVVPAELCTYAFYWAPQAPLLSRKKYRKEGYA